MAVRPKPRSRKPKGGGGRGLGNVDENLQRNADRASKSRANWVRIGDGNSVVVRIVTVGKDFKDGYVHPVEFEGRRGTFTRDVMCLDQKEEGIPCPGCRDDLDRRYKFWAIVIERDAEKTNSNDKVIGYEDAVKIMSGANRLVKAINKKHKRTDISKRDVEVSQDGEGFEVEYDVEWVDEKDTPLSDEDEKLIEDAKVVFERVEQYTTIPEFDDFYELPGRDDDDDDDNVGQRSRRRGSGFAERKGSKSSSKGSSRKRRQETDDDDDEEEDRPRRQRRSTSRSTTTSKKKPTGLAGLAAKKKTDDKPATRRRRSR